MTKRLLDENDRDWMPQGRCREDGTDPGIFFSDDPYAEATAKRLCAWCDVSEECLDYAIANNEPDGIWGGMTTDERRSIRRHRSRQTRDAHVPAMATADE